MMTSNFTTILTRVTCLGLGAALAGVGCYAAFEAASQANAGYLMFAAPVVALAAALIPVYFEAAVRARQWLRAAALVAVWLPAAAVVFLSATERNHAARAGGEAERAALRTIVDRAKVEMVEAKADRQAKTAAADKVRGLDAKACKAKCLSVRAAETAAINRVAAAENALGAAESKAVTESATKQDERLLPLAVDIAGMAMLAVGFGLGRAPVAPAVPAPAPAPVEVPAPAELVKRDRQIKRLQTELKKHRLRDKARKTTPRLVASK